MADACPIAGLPRARPRAGSNGGPAGASTPCATALSRRTRTGHLSAPIPRPCPDPSLASSASLATIAALIALVEPRRHRVGGSGTIFTVTTIADGNDGACDAQCSLREAVIAANAAADVDTIVLPAGTYVLERRGQRGSGCERRPRSPRLGDDPRRRRRPHDHRRRRHRPHLRHRRVGDGHDHGPHAPKRSRPRRRYAGRRRAPLERAGLGQGSRPPARRRRRHRQRRRAASTTAAASASLRTSRRRRPSRSSTAPSATTSWTTATAAASTSVART